MKDDRGQIIELRATWDPNSLGGDASDGRKVRGTIHWISAAHAINAEVRLYDRLFTVENPLDERDLKPFTDFLNPSSLEVIQDAKLEPSVVGRQPFERMQLERVGYFCVDRDSRPGALILNRTVALKDSWAKRK